MMNKNQIIIFTISFLVAGFFLVSRPEVGFSGPGSIPGGPPCCEITSESVCVGGPDAEPLCLSPESVCQTSTSVDCTFSRFGICVGEEGGEGSCVSPPQIPTLSQWGMIITIAVIGLFAVIGIFAMRRRSAVRS